MKAKRLVIKKPCTESWSGMTPQEEGRHCAKCDKVVVDLTSTDVRSAFRLVNQSEQNRCVRLFPKHLDYVHHEATNPAYRDFSLKAMAMGAALITFASLNSCTQQDPVTGKVEIHRTPAVDNSGKQAPGPGEASSRSTVRTLEEKKLTTYTVLIRYPYEEKVVREAGVIVFHGNKTDSLQTDKHGKCSFTITEKTFKVLVNGPYSPPVELDQRSFHSGKAVVELDYPPIMGEVAIEE